jgi:methylmalonyl-CoA mutase N-terminal domain/subunit
MDEAWALPEEKAVLIALRTQQIIAHESGITSSIDPMGGSFMVEALTNKMEEACYKYFDRIDSLGGVIPALEKGFFQREIAEAAHRYQQEIENGERIIVGLNDFLIDEPLTIPILKMDEDGEKRHLKRLNRVRRERSSGDVAERLRELKHAAQGTENLMPYILEAVRSYATLGEICGVLREVFGEYRFTGVSF